MGQDNKVELTNETFESLYSMLSFAREELLMHQNLSMPCINGEKNDRFVEHEKTRVMNIVGKRNCLVAKTFLGKLKAFFVGKLSERKLSNKPYKFSVTSNASVDDVPTNGKLGREATLFGAEVALYVSGFNNPSGEFSFNYLNTGYYTGGVAGYAAFLQQTITRIITIGRIRIESQNQKQLLSPLTVVDCDPTGRSITYPEIKVKELTEENKKTGSIEFDVDVTVYGGTTLSYQHIPGNTVTFYLYPAVYTLPLYPLFIRLKQAFRVIMGWDLYKDKKFKSHKRYIDVKDSDVIEAPNLTELLSESTTIVE